MRRFRRSRHVAAPTEPASHEVPLRELCWVLAPTDADPIYPACVTIDADRLVIDPATESTHRTDWSIGRLAHIDSRQADLEPHFVADDHTIVVMPLRFPSIDTAEAVLQRLLDTYERSTTQRFPHAWLQRISVPDSNA